MEQNQILIKQILEELLEKMDFSGQVSIGEETGSLVANIQSSEAAYLIGYNGENLQALQQIARVLVSLKTAEPVKFSVDINDYQKNRMDLLVRMAQNLAREAQEKKEARFLPPMNSYERRAIHVALAEFDGIKTESEGEGEERRIIIQPLS